MNDFLKSALRELVQKGVGIVALWLAAHGLPVPDEVSNWVVLALVGGGVALWTLLVRFLETRNSAVARKLAQLLMLGIAAKPTYTDPAAAPKLAASARASS